MLRALTVASLFCAEAAQAATVHFCWVGGNGHTMTGVMEFDDAALYAPMITEEEVTAFRIEGYRDGVLIGSWDMADRTATTTWYLRYLPREMRFPTNSEVPGPFDQGWNADGTATDCGAGGFGFNAGNYAQDFCLDGFWIEASGVPPETPFLAQPEAPSSPDCSGAQMLSARGRPDPAA